MKVKFLRALVVSSFFSTNLFAADVSVTSAKGRSMTMSSSGDQWTRAVSSVSLCANQNVNFKHVKLWMPDHGHGSSPTKIDQFNGACAQVSKINFTMLGKWELIVSTDDDDKAVFTVDVR